MAKYYDTLIWEYILNPWRKWLSLEEIALNEFDLKQESFENITKKWELNFDEIHLKIAWDYASFDNFVIKKIYDSHKIDETDEKLLKEIDFPLVEVLADIENTWVKVDEKILSEIWEYLKIEIEKEKAEVFKLAWKEFNISSLAVITTLAWIRSTHYDPNGITIKEFGAFVEFAPGKEGMVHISKIANERIDRVEDVLTLGDVVKVVCLGKDKMGRISFSIKDVSE